MKKIISMIAAVLLFVCSAVPAFAAQAPREVSVVINSPTAVEDKPVYENNLDITVTNTTDHTLNNLVCYLSIVDVDRGFSYNVDEFGPNAYQTHSITSLAAGESASVVIPVKVTYVGQFKFLISVVNPDTGATSTSNALSVHMIATSHLNNTLVLAVSITVSLVIIVGVFLLMNRRKQLGKQK